MAINCRYLNDGKVGCQRDTVLDEIIFIHEVFALQTSSVEKRENLYGSQLNRSKNIDREESEI